MTIVSKEDTRNSEWKKNNKGSALLKKMGWSEGQGLGRNNQGNATALRAVKRSVETLGIGASAVDTQGSEGWNETNDSFHGVLKKLSQHHYSAGSGSDSDKQKKKRKSEKRKKSLTLAKNRVTAGHAQKMRDAKDLSNKSEHDMRAIFGGTGGPVKPYVGAVVSGGSIVKDEKPKTLSSLPENESSNATCKKRNVAIGVEISAKNTKKKRKKEKKHS